MAEQNGLPDGWVIVDEPQMAASHEVQRPNTINGLALAGGAASVPVATRIAMESATNPQLPKIMSTVGQVAGGIKGLMHGGPLEAAGGAWVGGKAGWFTGRLMQKMATPLAKAAEVAAPYAQAVSTLSGAAGIGDLAQMAEPNRHDIGFLGIGQSLPDLDVLTAAVKKGATPTQAAAQIANGDPRRFAQLVTAYSQSLGQGRYPQTLDDPSMYRADGSRKGPGFLGALKRPDGKVSSELSIGVNIDGKEVEIPTLVPTLSKDEVNWLITQDISDPKKIPISIQQKAVDFARQRMAAGKSPFAQDSEGR